MRIAYVITGLDLGGAETLLVRLAERMKTTDEVVVITLLGKGDFATALKAGGVKQVPLHCENPFQVLPRLRKALKEFKPDVVHSYLWHANIAVRFAAAGLGAKIINTYLGKEPSKLRDLVEYCTRFPVDHYITNSYYIAQFFRLPQSRTTVIYNGIPSSFWKGMQRQPKKKTATMVGRLVWEKDFRTLIDAAAKAPDWQFNIVGSGPRQNELEKYILEKKVKNVHLLGKRTDVSQLLSKSECLIHLAFSEGSPIAIMEAMLLGVPVIASDIPAIREAVHKRGILVQPQDSDAVVAALNRIHKLPLAAVKKWARQECSVEQMEEKNRLVYRRLSS